MTGAAAQHGAPAPPPDDVPRRKRKPSGRLECKLGLLIGVGGLIGARLGQLWIAFDVFSQFTLQFGLVTAAFVIGLLMPRAKLLAAFLVIVVGLVAIGSWPHAVGGDEASRPVPHEGERPLRVASFNTWYSNERVEDVKAEIARLDADVVALLEFGPNKRPMLEALRAQYPHQANCFRIDYCNLVLLSKLPIADVQSEVIWDGPAYLAATLGPEAGGLTVMAVHTIRFPHSRAQYRQVVALGKLLEAMPGRKVVMGDFNATPFSRIVKTLEARAGLVRLTDLPSWPSQLGLPQIAIDHIFASPGIRPLSRQWLGRPVGADHYPIALDVGVPFAP